MQCAILAVTNSQQGMTFKKSLAANASIWEGNKVSTVRHALDEPVFDPTKT